MIFRELDTFKYLKYPVTFQYPVFKMKVSAGLARFNFSEIKTLNCFAGGSRHAMQPHGAVSSFCPPPQVTPKKRNFVGSITNYSYCLTEAEKNCLHFMSWNNRGYSQQSRIYFFAGCSGAREGEIISYRFTNYFWAADRHRLVFRWHEKIPS